MIIKIVRNIPAPIKSVFKLLGFNKLFSHFWNKYIAELAFQTEWAREFKENKLKVLEYWQKYRQLNEINTICKIQNNTKILDVGCGISTVLHFINGEKYGIDPLADEYKKLYRYPDEINVQKGFGENIPFPDEYFDIVFCSNVLDHVTDPQKTVEEIYRVLKPSGYFVLTVEIFKEKTKRDPAHPHSFTKRDVYLLLGGKFKTIFEKESPWIGLRAYVNGSRNSHNKELIMILEKI
jgi:ubiquinone/menaquinone biosynthesis C-methylase UbiE